MFTIAPDFNLRQWERSLEEVLLMDFETSVFFLTTTNPISIVSRAVYSHNWAENRMVGSKQDVVEELQVSRKSGNQEITKTTHQSSSSCET